MSLEIARQHSQLMQDAVNAADIAISTDGYDILYALERTGLDDSMPVFEGLPEGLMESLHISLLRMQKSEAIRSALGFSIPLSEEEIESLIDRYIPEGLQVPDTELVVPSNMNELILKNTPPSKKYFDKMRYAVIPGTIAAIIFGESQNKWIGAVIFLITAFLTVISSIASERARIKAHSKSYIEAALCSFQASQFDRQLISRLVFIRRRIFDIEKLWGEIDTTVSNEEEIRKDILVLQKAIELVKDRIYNDIALLKQQSSDEERQAILSEADMDGMLI